MTIISEFDLEHDYCITADESENGISIQRLALTRYDLFELEHELPV